MTIEINRPEIEALIRERLHSGAFESVEDVLFDALEIQSEREAWLQENKEAINAKIDADSPSSTGAKAYRVTSYARVWQPIRQRGSRTAPVREALPCRAGSRRRP